MAKRDAMILVAKIPAATLYLMHREGIDVHALDSDELRSLFGDRSFQTRYADKIEWHAPSLVMPVS